MSHIESGVCVGVAVFVGHVKYDTSIQIDVSGEIDAENVVDIELSSCVSVLCNPLKKGKLLLLSEITYVYYIRFNFHEITNFTCSTRISMYSPSVQSPSEKYR